MKKGKCRNCRAEVICRTATVGLMGLFCSKGVPEYVNSRKLELALFKKEDINAIIMTMYLELHNYLSVNLQFSQACNGIGMGLVRIKYIIYTYI